MRLPNSELQGMAWSEKIWISRKHLRFFIDVEVETKRIFKIRN